jgi:hypothetical protein
MILLQRQRSRPSSPSPPSLLPLPPPRGHRRACAAALAIAAAAAGMGTICAKCAGIAKIFASKSFGLGKDYLIQQREQSRKIRVIRPYWQSLANVEYFVAVTAKCVLMKHRLQPRSLIRVDLAPEGRESMFA